MFTTNKRKVLQYTTVSDLTFSLHSSLFFQKLNTPGSKIGKLLRRGQGHVRAWLWYSGCVCVQNRVACGPAIFVAQFRSVRHRGPSRKISPSTSGHFQISLISADSETERERDLKKQSRETEQGQIASSQQGRRRRAGRNGCHTSSDLRLLLFVSAVPASWPPAALHEQTALQGHGHGAQEEGEPVRRELVEAVVRRGAVRGGERGGVGGRVQEAGAAQGAEHGGEGRAAVQGGGARRHALLAGAAGPALQGRGPGPAQPRRGRRGGVALRARVHLAAAPRRRRRRGRRRARRLRRARRRAGRRRGGARGGGRGAVRRLRRARRPAGVGLIGQLLLDRRQLHSPSTV